MATGLAQAALIQDMGSTGQEIAITGTTVDRRLADLVAICGSAAPLESGEDGTARQVLVDVEHEGYRYLLIRMQLHTGKGVAALSPREQEIARMVAKGYPNKAIAAVLDISCWTVCTHLRRIFAKLNVSSRAAMVAQLSEEQGLRVP